MVGEVPRARVRLLQLGGALGHRALERVARGLQQLARGVLGGHVLQAPDPFLLGLADVDAPAAGAAAERRAVAALEEPLRVIRLAGRGALVGKPAGLLPILARGEQRRRALPDELARFS